MSHQAPDQGSILAHAPDQGSILAHAPAQGSILAQAPNQGSILAQAPAQGSIVAQAPDQGNDMWSLDIPDQVLVAMDQSKNMNNLSEYQNHPKSFYISFAGANIQNVHIAQYN